MNTTPARLHFIVARDADIVVIFRRGPVSWTQVIKWDLKQDSFEYGQWFRGRIYEQRGDISPSGKYLIYFAADYRRDRREFGPSWTAISRPPYLTALALWPENGAWEGGGFFFEDNCVALRTGGRVLASGYSLPQNFKVVDWHEQNIARKGVWKLHDLALDTKLDFKKNTICYRPTGKDTRLVQASHENGNEYFFIRQGGQDIMVKGGQCLDVDHQGRILIAAAGKLYKLKKKERFESLEVLQPIADFNENKPETVLCPKTMKRW